MTTDKRAPPTQPGTPEPAPVRQRWSKSDRRLLASVLVIAGLAVIAIVAAVLYVVHLGMNDL